MPQWTKDQKDVICSSSKRIICSAAAGSGKTAVMIERIVRLIREGADPFSFLVITFTNAAAAEMKEKIRQRLISERRNPVIAAALEKAGGMEICTIHAFCQRLIRREFQAVGIDPSFQVCTGSQRKQLFDEAFRDGCDQLNKKKDKDYRTFIRQYDQEKAKEIIREVYEFIMSLEDPFTWLKTKMGDVPKTVDRNHPWFRIISRIVKEKSFSLQILLRRQAEMFNENEKQEAYREIWKADNELIQKLIRWSEEETVPEERPAGEFIRLPVMKNLNSAEIDWKERYQALRRQLRDAYKGMVSLIFVDMDQTLNEFSAVSSSIRGMVKIIEKTHQCFGQNKKRECVLDFNDLEHKALEILQSPYGQKSAQDRYGWIFVDECQDISSIQNAIIEELSGKDNSVFMVGDVKQSIYRFRQANPGLFLERLTGEPENTQSVFYLQENFRSRPEILETANMVFRDIMKKETSEVEYTRRDELIAGRTDCPGFAPVFADLVEPEKGMSRLEAAADYAAGQILELVETDCFQFRDIVILMPEVSTDGPVLAKLLKERNIPIFFDGRGDFFQKPEISIFRNLLMLLADPKQDLALIAALVNPPFCFTEEELSRIRIENGEWKRPFHDAFEKAEKRQDELGIKCRHVREKIREWRFRASRMNLNDLLWYLGEETGLYVLSGVSDENGTARRNIRILFLQAAAAEKRGICKLQDFLNLLSDQESTGEMQAASALGEEDDVVRIMTIHKSKGLQFPVVFCLGLDKGVAGRPGGTVRLDAELGVCLPYKVADCRLSRKTTADSLFEWKNERDTKAEKICLLYVAMTRARERLYLVGTEHDRPLWHIPSGEHRVMAASDYMDWIMPALLDCEKNSTAFTQATKPWKIRIFKGNQQETVEMDRVIHNLRPWVESVLSADPVDELWKAVPEEETARTGKNRVDKKSVTTLLRNNADMMLNEEKEQTPAEKRIPDYVEKVLNRYRPEVRPVPGKEKKEADGAQRGTAIHRFMSLVDLDRIREAGEAGEELLESFRKEFLSAQVFSEEEASWIRPDKITRFFASSLGKRMLVGEKVHREWEFTLFLRERELMVQGMVDCAFLEEGEWILIDYKTDTIHDETAFVERYRPQLEWYASAISELSGITVRECWLYSLSVDKAFRVL